MCVGGDTWECEGVREGCWVFREGKNGVRVCYVKGVLGCAKGGRVAGCWRG